LGINHLPDECGRRWRKIMLDGVIIARIRVRVRVSEGSQDGWSDKAKESARYLAWCLSDLFLKRQDT